MFLALCVFLSSVPAAFAADSDPVVARVQGSEIHASEFAAAAKKAKPADGVALTPDERRVVLDGLVDERLLALEAQKSQETLNNPLVRKALVRAYLEEEVYEEIKEPTDAVLQKFYEQNPGLYATAETARASRMLVRVGPKVTPAAAKAAADKLYAAVAKDPKRTFAATAKKASGDENRDQGGDMGFVTRADKKLDKTVLKTVFFTKVATVSKVFMTREGANIVYVSARRAPAPKTFEQAHADVKKRWKAAKMDDAKKARMAKIEKASKVAVDDAALTAVVLPVRKARPTAVKPAKPGKPAAAKPAAGKVKAKAQPDPEPEIIDEDPESDDPDEEEEE